MAGKATFGLDENIAGLCCYAGGWITGIIFLVSEKENKKVRFHALQSIIWFGAMSVLMLAVNIVFGILTAMTFGLFHWISWIFTGFFGLVIFLSWLLLMFTAYSGSQFKIPVIGDAVESTVNK